MDCAVSLSSASSLVVDLIDLGRKAGSMIEVERTVPAPEDLGIAVIGVPQGSDLFLTVRIESLEQGVLATGSVHAHLVGECARCLDEITSDVDQTFQELFFYEDQPLEDEDEEVLRFGGDELDLEPVLRDLIVTALPLAPVCRDDCPGLCSECGARLADDPAHKHDIIDARWAALLDVQAQEPEL